MCSEKAPCTQMAVFAASLAGCKMKRGPGVTLAQAHHCGGVCRASPKNAGIKRAWGPQVVWLQPTLPPTHTHTASHPLLYALSYGNVCNLWRSQSIGLVFVPKSLLALRNRYFSVCICVIVSTSFIWRATASTHTHTHFRGEWKHTQLCSKRTAFMMWVVPHYLQLSNLHWQSDEFAVW